MIAINKLKRLVKSFIHGDAAMSVDFLYCQNGTLLITGWCVHKTAPVGKVITAEISGVSQNVELFAFERPDVMSRYGLQSNDYVFGFVGLIKAQPGDVNKLTLSHSGAKFSLSKFNYAELSYVADIAKQAGDKMDNAIGFLKSLNVDVETKGNGSAPIRRRYDKDVEKIKSILQSANVHNKDFYRQCHAELIPEVHKVWKTRQDKKNDVEVRQYGEAITSPRLSIIVPIYGRYDFIQHQVAHFSVDPDFEGVELVYVLDDPKLEHEVSVSCVGIYNTFSLPFKVVYSQQNLGFAGANNLGVKYASSDVILLLNSDIIPQEKKWVSNYLEQFSSTDTCGILGATLLYEDGTIQHSGMEFREDSSYPNIPMNHHPFKGVPSSLIDELPVRQVQLTTGACMMMLRSDFIEVEGFDFMYVLGDFEDSDLCLKFVDRGKGIFVSSSVKFYHLERLSQNLVDAGDWKFKLTLMNGAYQAGKWQELLKKNYKL